MFRTDAFENFRNTLSLRSQIAWLFALLCLILVLGLALVAADIARRQANERVEGSMLVLAENMASRLDTYMAERFRDVSDVASMDALRPVWSGSTDDVRQVLEQMQGSFPAFTWIGFADLEGKIVAATDGLLEGESVAARPWFQNGLERAGVEDVHDAKLLDSLLGPQPSGEPFRFVDVAVPVIGPDGTQQGVLGAHLSWTWSTELRDALVAQMPAESMTSVWILRSDGRVLLGPEYDMMPLPALQVARANGAGETSFVDMNSEPTLTAMVKASDDTSSGLGWIVVARRPLAVAHADAQTTAGAILAIGLALATLGMTLAWLVATRLTRPLDDLSHQVDRIGRDPVATMVSRRGGSRDVLKLSTAIRSLLRRVGTAEEAQHEAERATLTIQERMDERARTLGEHISTLQVLADTDPLTHLLNRRAFLVFASDAMNYFRRYGRDICVLVIDIDFFKAVNDTFGHGAGDDVIEHVGSSIQRMVRTTDKVARFGGEEFVVLLRETDLDNALQLADRMRREIELTAIEVRGGALVNVTVSTGLARAEATDRDISDVIERADRALYRAKTTGRNRVVADTSDAVSAAA